MKPFLLRVYLASLFGFLVFSTAYAQLTVRGSIGVDLSLTEHHFKIPKLEFDDMGQPLESEEWTSDTQEDFTLRGHLELDYEASRQFGVHIVYDPILSSKFDPEVHITEAFALWSQRSLDVSVGIERLPLETARLFQPFVVEETDLFGTRLGVPGARVSWFVDDFRTRIVGYYQDGTFIPVIGLRNNFGSFELEFHALYSDYITLGLTGSGSIDDVIIYGESWYLNNAQRFEASNEICEPQLRLLLGGSGYVRDNLWTLEAGFLPGEQDEKLHFQTLGQLSIPDGDFNTWTVEGGLALPEAGPNVSVRGQFSHAQHDGEVSVQAHSFLSEDSISIGLALGFTGFFLQTY